MPLKSEEVEMVLQLLEDVAAIEAANVARFPTAVELRTVFTPILRRWIADGGFFTIQKLLASPLTFTTYSHVDDVTACKLGAYKWWMGPVDCGEGLIVKPAVSTRKYAPGELQERKLFEIAQKAKLFFEQKMFWWKGQFYTREDLIKFAANKLGGVHYDLNRNLSFSHVEEIQNHFAIQYRHELKDIYIVPPGEIAALRTNPEVRSDLYDAIQLCVGDTANIFVRGIQRSADKIRALLN